MQPEKWRQLPMWGRPVLAVAVTKRAPGVVCGTVPANELALCTICIQLACPEPLMCRPNSLRRCCSWCQHSPSSAARQRARCTRTATRTCIKEFFNVFIIGFVTSAWRCTLPRETRPQTCIDETATGDGLYNYLTQKQ